MNRDQNLKFIREELRYLGVTEFPEKELADKINSGMDKIRLTGKMEFSQYGKQQDMHYEIFLKHYERPNLYHPYMYQATLDGQPDKTAAFKVSQVAFFTLPDTFNLLNGRAVQKLIYDQQQKKMYNDWFQLNFNKKDVHGNFRVDQLGIRDHEYLVSKALSKYDVKQLMVPDERNTVITSLLRGNVQPVTLLKDGGEIQGYAQASPRNRTVEIFNSEGQRLPESQRKSKTEKMAAEPPVRVLTAGKRKGKSL